MENLDLLEFLGDLNIEFNSFSDLVIPPHMPDRMLWQYCQAEGHVLWTDNRNSDEQDSLEATLADSWSIGCLPVLTLANKRQFETDRQYAERVAADIAELLFGIQADEYREQSRIWVPM